MAAGPAEQGLMDWQRLVRSLSPIELVAFATLAVSLLLVYGCGLRWYLPSAGASAFATEHYIYPMLLALSILFWRNSRRRQVPVPVLVLQGVRFVLSYSLIIYLHFNLKLWAHLANSSRWDIFYELSDEMLAPVVQALGWLHRLWEGGLAHWPGAYHDVFVAMFVVSLLAHSLGRRNGRDLSEVATAIALILSIGGLAYMATPAWGPFVFGMGTNPLATKIQGDMVFFTYRFANSGGTFYEGGNFIMALGAMPSLHAAHSLTLFLYAWKRLRWLGWCYLPAVLFIITEAVSAKWHYVVDLLVGVLLALLCIRLAAYLHRCQEEESDSPMVRVMPNPY